MTNLKERPILFSGAMVRAILACEKTQTRRVVKGIPAKFCCGDVAAVTNGESWAISKLPDCVAYPPDDEPGILCPYGQPGDRLWVRETWNVGDDKHNYYVQYRADSDGVEHQHSRSELDPGDEFLLERWANKTDEWNPSIFMPRWASRITLEITDVRVERLQDISERDAWAEGCLGTDDDVTGGISGYSEYYKLWESINGKTAPWASNPWVWVLTFKRA